MSTEAFVKSRNIDADVFENELLLMNLDNRKVLVLNESARVIWEALDLFPSKAQLLALLNEGITEASTTELEFGLADLLDTLTRYGFISAAEAG